MYWVAHWHGTCRTLPVTPGFATAGWNRSCVRGMVMITGLVAQQLSGLFGTMPSEDWLTLPCLLQSFSSESDDGNPSTLKCYHLIHKVIGNWRRQIFVQNQS
uniref:Uncharacterized protein n=1 Tax=Arundo donax TaxID=35708 RepID=A0A0A9HA98_ARUDO